MFHILTTSLRSRSSLYFIPVCVTQIYGALYADAMFEGK